MGIRPDQFWTMTPYEFFLQQRGHSERDRENQRILAWHACNVMQPHVKKKLSVGKLLGETKVLTDMDPEQRKATLEEVKVKERKKKAAGRKSRRRC